MNALATAIGYVWLVLAGVLGTAYIVVALIPQAVWSLARRTRYAKVLWIAMRRIYRERYLPAAPDIPGAGPAPTTTEDEP